MNDKELVAHQALQYVNENMIVGLGTGSTANYFIDALSILIKLSFFILLSDLLFLFEIKKVSSARNPNVFIFA